MTDASGSEAAQDEAEKAAYRGLQQAELEAKVVEAIQHHRRLVDADQLLYEEWVQSAEDPATPASVRQALQEQYLLRQTRTGQQQDRLMEMVEVLGYIPSVPESRGASSPRVPGP